MYKSLVRPHLDYCDVIFHYPPDNNGIFDGRENNHGTLNALMVKIESVQYQAALAITGTWQGTSRSKLYDELGFESLSNRRSLNRILQLFKINNNLTPDYLRLKLPILRYQNQPNANPNIFYEYASRTIRFKKTFFPNAISSWNNIFANVQGDVTKSSIKSHILELTRPQPKSFYNIHDPIGLHYLFQLRTGLSPLRCHKFRHNFQDTPDENCSCNHGFEDTSHFLFTCLNFTIHRASLAVDIINILRKYNLLNLANNAKFYLYGHRELSSEDNKKVLSCTIRYVKNSGRFTR